MFYFHPLNTELDLLTHPLVIGNLLFLGVVASMVCYLSWTIVIDKLGIICSTNYIYVIPLVTLITSAIVLGEHITIIAFIGALLVVGGVYLAEHHRK